MNQDDQAKLEQLKKAYRVVAAKVAQCKANILMAEQTNDWFRIFNEEEKAQEEENSIRNSLKEFWEELSSRKS